MRLDYLLEAAHTDVERLIAEARAHDCAGPLVIAGGLANGLGTALSDVDLVAFGTGWRGACPHALVAVDRRRWGLLTVDLLRVDESAFRAACVPLREHLLAVPPRPMARVPYEILVLLHALQAGQVISGSDELTGLKDEVGSDMFPTLAALRSLTAFLTHMRDARQLHRRGGERATRTAARQALEAAADAALAGVSAANPNPKWRVMLVERAARDPELQWVPWNRVADALSPLGTAPETVALLALACELVTTIVEQLPLGMYWEGAAARAASCAALSGSPSTDGDLRE